MDYGTLYTKQFTSPDKNDQNRYFERLISMYQKQNNQLIDENIRLTDEIKELRKVINSDNISEGIPLDPK
jgi:hypothetical protein